MTDKKPVPPSLAQFALEQLAEAGELAAIDLTVQNVEILRQEIVKRDARIAELEAPMLAWAELDYTKHTRRSLMCYIGQQNFRITAQENQLAALKAQQPSGVVLPKRADTSYGTGLDTQFAEAYNEALDEVERLNPCRAQAVPDGYVLVPVEPTPEMIAAMIKQLNKSPVWYCRHTAVYRAMLEASESLLALQGKEVGDE